MFPLLALIFLIPIVFVLQIMCPVLPVLLFAEWLDTHILGQVSHAQFVFTIPKLLRPIFRTTQRNSACSANRAWQALKEMFQKVAADPSALPGVVISIQSYGDNRISIPISTQSPAEESGPPTAALKRFPPSTRSSSCCSRHHVIKNLLAADRISQTTVDILDRFHHPGFSAYEGEGVSALDSAARERLASYLVHAPFSLARLHYDRDAGVVTYDSRASQRSHLNSPAPERISPLDALAALTAFIPEKGLQLARYYGYYSNKTRGQRRRQDTATLTPMAASLPDAPQDDDFRRFCRRAWARLIRKVYLADPTTCPKCGGRLRILSFIENPSVIEKILPHLKLWDFPERSPPPRRLTTLEPDADFLDWVATARNFDGID